VISDILRFEDLFSAATREMRTDGLVGLLSITWNGAGGDFV
jgi:hypothetical protein